MNSLHNFMKFSTSSSIPTNKLTAFKAFLKGESGSSTFDWLLYIWFSKQTMRESGENGVVGIVQLYY